MSEDSTAANSDRVTNTTGNSVTNTEVSTASNLDSLRNKTGNSTTNTEDSTAASSVKLTGTDAVLHDAQQLFKAAEQMLRESCNEQWLLQPFIPDMERNEYRWD